MILASDDHASSASQESQQIDRDQKKNIRPRIKKRNRVRHAVACFLPRIIIWIIVLTAALQIQKWVFARLQQMKASVPSAKQVRRGHSAFSTRSSQLLKHQELYDEIQKATKSTRDHIPVYRKRPYILTSMYGSKVMELGCNLTVLFMDPRLATARPGEPAWYSLESVAAFSGDAACVLLQTGKRCPVLKWTTEKHNSSHSPFYA